MALERRIDGSEPVRSGSVAGSEEHRRQTRSTRLGTGTLACPRCDAPVALPAERLTPAAELACPFCGHAASLRDFLSLSAPSRPTRVEVHVVPRARGAAG